MKTVLVEPLTIGDDLLVELSKKLNENGNVFIHYDEKPKDIEEWVKRIDDADQIIMANTKMPEEVLDKVSNLKYINVAFTGVDHLPVKKAKEKGIIVTNAAGYSDEGVAELVLGFSISLLRKLKESDEGLRNEKGSLEFLGSEISGKTVGVIGTGKIGSRVCELFKAFNANVVGYNRSESAKLKEEGVKYLELDELLKISDIITVHLPLNDSTTNFIREKHFKMMKDNAIFINCARGPIVDNEALSKALINREIRAAAIDVFDYEPPLDKDYNLLKAPNTILTPHIAYFTKEAMEKRAKIVFKNSINYLEGKELNALV